MADSSPQKRAQAIDALLARPEYVDYWTLYWGDLLRAHRRALGEKGLASFNGWLRTALRENRPFDRVARELLTARGNLVAVISNGTAVLYAERPGAFADLAADLTFVLDLPDDELVLDDDPLPAVRSDLEGLEPVQRPGSARQRTRSGSTSDYRGRNPQ